MNSLVGTAKEIMYQKLISEIDSDVNPVGVEAAMRSEYGTLDHLSRAEFAVEVRIAKQYESDDPGFLRMCAEGWGMETEFDAWIYRNKSWQS